MRKAGIEAAQIKEKSAIQRQCMAAGGNAVFDPQGTEAQHACLQQKRCRFIDFGDWTGMRFDELAARADWRAFNTFRAMALVPGGETMQQAQTRAINAILRLRATFPGQAVVVVSHGDIIKSVIAHVLAVPLDLFRRIEISPASCSMLVLEDEDVRIEAVNLPPSIG